MKPNSLMVSLIHFLEALPPVFFWISRTIASIYATFPLLDSLVNAAPVDLRYPLYTHPARVESLAEICADIYE